MDKYLLGELRVKNGNIIHVAGFVNHGIPVPMEPNAQGIVEDLAEIRDIAAEQENYNNREPAPHTLTRSFEEANFKDEQIDHGY